MLGLEPFFSVCICREGHAFNIQLFLLINSPIHQQDCILYSLLGNTTHRYNPSTSIMLRKVKILYICVFEIAESAFVRHISVVIA